MEPQEKLSQAYQYIMLSLEREYEKGGTPTPEKALQYFEFSGIRDIFGEDKLVMFSLDGSLLTAASFDKTTRMQVSLHVADRFKNMIDDINTTAYRAAKQEMKTRLQNASKPVAVMVRTDSTEITDPPGHLESEYSSSHRLKITYDDGMVIHAATSDYKVKNEWEHHAGISSDITVIDPVELTPSSSDPYFISSSKDSVRGKDRLDEKMAQIYYESPVGEVYKFDIERSRFGLSGDDVWKINGIRAFMQNSKKTTFLSEVEDLLEEHPKAAEQVIKNMPAFDTFSDFEAEVLCREKIIMPENELGTNEEQIQPDIN